MSTPVQAGMTAEEEERAKEALFASLDKNNPPALNLVVDRLLDILARLENTNILVTDTIARIYGPFPPVNDVGDPVSPAGTIPRINDIIDTIEIRCNRLQEGVREISKI